MVWEGVDGQCLKRGEKSPSSTTLYCGFCLDAYYLLCTPKLSPLEIGPFRTPSGTPWPPHSLLPFPQVTPSVDETQARFIKKMETFLTPGICECPTLLLSVPLTCGSNRLCDPWQGSLPWINEETKAQRDCSWPTSHGTRTKSDSSDYACRICLHTWVYVWSWVWPSGHKSMFYTLFPVPNRCLKPAALSPPWASIPGCGSVPGLPQQITKHRATYIIDISRLTVLEAGRSRSRSRHQQGWFLLRPLSLTCRQLFSPYKAC